MARGVAGHLVWVWTVELTLLTLCTLVVSLLVYVQYILWKFLLEWNRRPHRPGTLVVPL